MLVSLNIKNYALIESLYTEFTDGLNVLTGETGAGKSIIVGALSLAFGYRASADALRTGADKISVQAEFYVKEIKDSLSEILDEYGIDLEDNILILRREVHAAGRNVCRINNTAVNVAVLRQAASALADIHGQHEHQKLLDPQMHITYLDEFGRDVIIRGKEAVKQAFRHLKENEKKLAELTEQSKSSGQKKEEYQKALSEIVPLGLTAGEDERLESRLKKLMNSEKLHEAVNEAYKLLYSSDTGINPMLLRASGFLEKAAALDENLSAQYRLLDEAQINIDETAAELRQYLGSLEFNNDELDDIHSRLNRINQLKRKYAHTIEGILEYAEECREGIALDEKGEEMIAEAKKTLDKSFGEYKIKADELSRLRKETAVRFETELAAVFKELVMENAVFKVHFEETSPAENGTDSVSFLISANPGQELRNLAKIASGGEVSRVMLAFKTVLAGADSTDTLIFDEIDTGISGRTAQSVANMLCELSRSHQILCITHLPQISSMADSHYLIEKKTQDNDTFTSLVPLDGEERLAELARMLGGVEVTQTTLSHAEELLELAQDFRKSLK